MQFTITRSSKNNVISTIIAFAGYGNAVLTAEQEQSLLEQFPINLTYTGIDFSGKYNISPNNQNSVVADATSGENVTLAVNNQDIPLDDKFQVTYQIDIKKIIPTEIGEILNTAELVGIAKCQLFEDKIFGQLTSLLNDVKTHDSDYINDSPIDITI